jgi:hypothetical protein
MNSELHGTSAASWQVLRGSATAIHAIVAVYIYTYIYIVDIYIQKHFAISREASKQLLIQIIQMHAQTLSFSESAPDAKFVPLVPVAFFICKAVVGGAIGWGVKRALNKRFG